MMFGVQHLSSCALLLCWAINSQAFDQHRFQGLRGISALNLNRSFSQQSQASDRRGTQGLYGDSAVGLHRNVSQSQVPSRFPSVGHLHDFVQVNSIARRSEQAGLLALCFFGALLLAYLVQPRFLRVLDRFHPGHDDKESEDSGYEPPKMIQEDIQHVQMRLKTPPYPNLDGAIYYLMSTSWTALGLIMFEVYIVIAAFFAILLTLQDDSLSGGSLPLRFLDAFNFSIQTLATIGYGKLLPSSGWGHTIVMVESYMGLVMVAIGGGILFSRVNRPTSCLVFTDVAVVNENDAGQIEISIRMLNQRVSVAWLDARASISVLIQEGQSRSMQKLKLKRDWNPILRGSWMLMHTVDEESPLHGLISSTEVNDNIIALIAFVKGTDSTFYQHLFAHKVYYSTQFRFKHSFAQMVCQEDNMIYVDAKLLSETSDTDDMKGTRSRSYMF